jgi:hypothetical protein
MTGAHDQPAPEEALRLGAEHDSSGLLLDALDDQQQRRRLGHIGTLLQARRQ